MSDILSDTNIAAGACDFSEMYFLGFLSSITLELSFKVFQRMWHYVVTIRCELLLEIIYTFLQVSQLFLSISLLSYLQGGKIS